MALLCATLAVAGCLRVTSGGSDDVGTDADAGQDLDAVEDLLVADTAREASSDATDAPNAPAWPPSNVGDRLDYEPQGADLVVGADMYNYWVLDADTGAIDAYDGEDEATAELSVVRAPGLGRIGGISYAHLTQTGPAPSLAVFSFASLDIGFGARLQLRGARPVVLLITGLVAIAGEVQALAGGFPGGGKSESGSGPGGGAADSSIDKTGGGGASYGGSGGQGGGGAAPGVVHGAEDLVPLFGGSGGGAGLRPGGQGGGALQISSLASVTVASTGQVGANGKGGGGGTGSSGGGGAGGSLLLEAPTVVVEGALGVNGGAGGGSSLSTTPGEDGQTTQVPAIGGGTPPGSGLGGDGSDADGQAGSAFVDGGGAGGGGGGRIRINTEAGNETYAIGLLPTMSSGLATVGTLPL